ncbi:GPCR-chaperone-domain-containing protein [Chytriomyces sp. MP71]|nr:GPCR-chaperone-domain-containing protein [Chytriomyces sp. MP71]
MAVLRLTWVVISYVSFTESIRDWMAADHLFRLVFANDSEALQKALDDDSTRLNNGTKAVVADHMRGHNLLTLALALNNTSCASVLLAHESTRSLVLAKNASGWRAIHEAASLGSREALKEVLLATRSELGRWFHSSGRQLLETLAKDLNDFYLELKWEFSSNWLPFLSQICPSDTCKIHKKGTSVRIDTTLVGFENLSWIRGDISLIFTETKEGPKLVLCDHQRRVVQQIYPHDFTLSEQDIEEEISITLNSPLVAAPEFDFSAVQVTRLKTGLLFKSDRTEKIGPYNCAVYSIKNLAYTQKKRDEHLHVHPLPTFLIPAASMSPVSVLPPRGGALSVVNSDRDWASEDNTPQLPVTPSYAYADDKPLEKLKAFRPSLPPLPPPSYTWDAFANANKDVKVGRPQNVTDSRKEVSATIWMYDSTLPDPAAPDTPTSTSTTSLLGWVARMALDTTLGPSPATPTPSAPARPQFPIQLSTLLPLLDLLGLRNEHVRALRDFLHIQLPRGFPVRVEIPVSVLPLSAQVTFENVGVGAECVLADTLFVVPGKRMGYVRGEVIEGSRFEAVEGSGVGQFWDKL